MPDRPFKCLSCCPQSVRIGLDSWGLDQQTKNTNQLIIPMLSHENPKDESKKKVGFPLSFGFSWSFPVCGGGFAEAKTPDAKMRKDKKNAER